VTAAAISAIVPAYNAAATLPACLAPLLAMRAAGEIAEIVVVDDGSTDATATVAADLGARVVPSGGRLGPGGARNVAAAGACGDVLWFVDADVVVHADAACRLAAALERSGAAAVFGAYDDAPPAANFFSQYKNLVHHHYHREAEGPAATFWAGCGAIRKADFVAAGGFDAARYPHPSIEDIELGMRLVESGRAIWLAPDVQATHLKVWRLPNLLHTEIFRRALPWSRLLHARSGRGATLNVRPAERLRALLAIALFASIPLAAFGIAPAWAPLALLAAALAANVDLFRLFRRRRGMLFALGGLLFHQVYYGYSAAAYAWAWLARGDDPSPTSSAR
jgi:GT2 family glycosyltransferase